MAATTTTTGLIRLCHWALGYAWRRRPQVLTVIGATLFRIGLDVLKPWPMVFLIDYVLQAKPMPSGLARVVAVLPGVSTPANLIGWSVLATVLVFLLSWAVGLTITYANITLGQRMTYDLAADLFAKLQQLSLHFHARHAVGDTVRRVTADCGCVSTIIKDALLPVLGSVISLVALFTILWHVDPTLTLLALGVVPCMVLVFHLYAGPMMDRSYEQQQIEGRLYSQIEQVFSALPVVQAFCREPDHDAQFRQITRDTISATLALTKVQLQFKVWIGLSTALGTAGIVWLGSRHALAGQLSLGAILLFLSYLGSLYAPLEAVMYSASTVQGAAGSTLRVWEVLQAEQHIQDKPSAIRLHRTSGRVTFQNVTFGYEPGRPVLRDISLEVAPGETVALVGPTGAGKSTLVGLIPRFFDPWAGRVLLDGQDVRDLQLNSLRRHISIVLQEPFLFPISIAENIAYGRPDATRSEIEAAARAAGASEFIGRLPDGFDTVPGERGATLSVGERQRLSIARALLKNAPLLILDEPSSALDVATEASLMEALERLTRGRTTFIIAHRLSTVRKAGRIVVLKDGSISEFGTHEELLKHGELYALFHQLQSGAAPLDPKIVRS